MEESGCLLKRRGIGLKVGRLGGGGVSIPVGGWLAAVKRASRLRNSIDAFSALGVEYWLLSTNFGIKCGDSSLRLLCGFSRTNHDAICFGL